jgi:predicted MPP superfamily phosphohydrolase
MRPDRKQIAWWARHLALVLILALFTGLVVLVAWIEPNRLQMSRQTFYLPGLGGDEAGIRLVFATDLHIRRPGRIHHRIMEEAAAFEPDLVLLGGDYFTWLTSTESLAGYLGRFKAPGGVFAIQGNWEYKVQVTGRRLAGLLAEQGIRLLVNEHLVIRIRGAALVLLGLDDPYTGHADFYSTFLDVPEGLPQVMLAHSPEIYRKARRWGVHLVLSGHTHGGQLNFPLIGPLWIPPGSRQTVAGRFDLDGTWLYVSRGVGTSIIPARLRCPPELVLVTLKDASFDANAGTGRRPEAGKQREGTAGPAGENQHPKASADPLG